MSKQPVMAVSKGVAGKQLPLCYSILLAITLCLLSSCTFFTSDSNPVQRAIQQWGSSVQNFAPSYPMVLVAFDIQSCISCGALAIKLIQDKIAKYNLAANLLIVIAVDQPGESQAAIPSNFHNIVVEDTNGTLEKFFDVRNYPTLLIVDSKGKIRYRLFDPVHNFPSDDILLRYLAPIPIDLSYRGNRLQSADQKSILIEITDVSAHPSQSMVYAVDGKQNALFSITPHTAQMLKIWKASDSLRYHPDYQSQLSDSLDWWEKLRQQVPIAFAKLEAVVYASSSVVVLQGSLLRRKGRAVLQVPSLFYLSSSLPPRVLSLRFLPHIPGKLVNFQILQNQLLALSASPDQLAVYSISPQDTFRRVADLPQDTLLPSIIQRRVYSDPSCAINRTTALIFDLKLPSMVMLVFAPDTLRIDAVYRIPLTGTLYRYRLRYFRKFIQSFGEIQGILSSLQKSSSPIWLDSPVSLSFLNDTVWVVSVPYTDKRTNVPHLAVQWYTLRGLFKERIYSFDQEARTDRYVTGSLLVSNHRLYFVLKWKKRGWYVYPIPT